MQSGTARKFVNLMAVFTVQSEERTAAEELQAMAAADRAVPAPDEAEALREVCEKADLVLFSERASIPPERPAPHGLTGHELRLLGLLVEGHSYKSAATRLGVSVSTVAFHLQKIYGKLNVHSKVQAVARGLSEGWLGKKKK